MGYFSKITVNVGPQMISRRCILHVGMPKTGTSSLQFSLADYDDGDWAYAQIRMATRDVNHSAALILATQSQHECEEYEGRSREIDSLPRIFDRIKAATGVTPIVKDYHDALIAAFDTAKDRNIILSGEGVFWETNCLPGLYTILNQHFSDILVVGYLRPLGEQIVSRLQQRLRASDPETFFEVTDFVRNSNALGMLACNIPLRLLSATFGASNVLFLPYSKAALGEMGIVQDFMSRFDLTPALIPEVRTNIGLSAEATAVLYALSFYGNSGFGGDNFGRSKQALNNLLSDFGHRSLGISAGLAEKINVQCRTDIDWIENEYSISIAAHGCENDFDITTFSDLLDLAQQQIPAFCQHITERWEVCLPKQNGQLEKFVTDVLVVLQCDLRGRVKRLPDSFDPKTYLNMYNDVRDSGDDGNRHFLNHGYFEGRLF